MHRPGNGLSTRLFAGFLLLLADLVSFSVTPALSIAVPRSPFQCKDMRAHQCEDKRQEWFVPFPSFRCEGRYKDGRKPTVEEFSKILENHAVWLAAYADVQPLSSRYVSEKARTDTRRANLCGADLRDLNLQGVDLRGANLQGANLTGKNLSDMNLEEADLLDAILIRTLSISYKANLPVGGTDLCGAGLKDTKLASDGLSEVNATRATLDGIKLQIIDWSNLCGAALLRIDLRGSHISNTVLSDTFWETVDLSGAVLENVNLSRSSLRKVNLQNARFINVDLSEAEFHPDTVEGLLIVGAKGLSTINLSNPLVMITLRKALKDAGLRSEERAVTSALRKFSLNTERREAQYFAYAMGGWITDFGADPWRSFKILGWVILFCAFIYIWALKKYEQWHHSKKRAGIWVVWPVDRIRKVEGGEPIRVTSTFFFPNVQVGTVRAWWKRPFRWCCVLFAGFYFSFLSAFHLGWRDLSVGTWIARLQPREYTLRATGWVRVVSGVQSVFSIYLLAWWVVTYFGRPFE